MDFKKSWVYITFKHLYLPAHWIGKMASCKGAYIHGHTSMKEPKERKWVLFHPHHLSQAEVTRKTPTKPSLNHQSKTINYIIQFSNPGTLSENVRLLQQPSAWHISGWQLSHERGVPGDQKMHSVQDMNKSQERRTEQFNGRVQCNASNTIKRFWNFCHATEEEKYQ